MSGLSIKDRIKIPRHKAPEQSPGVRSRNFEEVCLGFGLEEAKEEALRCIECPKPSCVAGCPVGIDIPRFVKLVGEGAFLEAAHVLKEKNILPAICGRVCPQEKQCEQSCVIGRRTEPVSIGKIERFVADFERLSGRVELPKPGASTGCSVAIVGSGPAGITGAFELARLGHRVTLFEAMHKPGGVLYYGIPRFRLPSDVIESELKALEYLGVEIFKDAVIGKALSIEDIFKMGYDSILLGTGAGLPKMLGIPGENLVGVYSANEWLTRLNLMRADLFPAYATPIEYGKNIVVIGAGDAAMDGARTSIRLQPEAVTLVYRRSRAEAPCRVEELHHAEEEGVKTCFLTSPVRFIGDSHYKLKAIEVMEMALGEPDSSGRRRPIPIEGSNWTIECDTAIIALGCDINPLVTRSTPGLELTKSGIVVVNTETGMSSIPGLFAAGDVITGGSTVISAMGQAKVAAKGIHDYLVAKKGLRLQYAAV